MKRHLLPDERVIWEGRPFSGIIFRPIDVLIIFAGFAWGDTIIFGHALPERGQGPAIITNIFLFTFLLFVIYIIAGRFIIDVILRRRLTYFVTDRRILIIRGANGSKSKSLDIKRLPALELDERSDGSGTIRFAALGKGWYSDGGLSFLQPAADPIPQFMRIPNVRTVYELIHKQAST